MKINIGDNWKDITASKINIETNLISYSGWTTGSLDLGNAINDLPWYVQDFSGASYSVIDGIGPFGFTDKIIRKGGTLDNSRQRLYTDYLSTDDTPALDITKSYRYSMWLRWNNDGVSYPSSNMYWWCDPETENVVNINTEASSSTGYFVSGDCTTYTGTDAEWRLYIAYLRPYGWSETTFQGGVYDTDGNKQATPIDYKFGETTSGVFMQIWCPYNSDSSFDLLYPRIDVIDGTEPSFETLLTNEGAWRVITASKINIGDTWKTIGAAEEFSLSGGTKTTDGGDDIHTFTSDGTLTVTGSGTVTLLIVGHGVNGESAASYQSGAGGNGGEIIYSTSYAITEGTYPVTITGTVAFDGNTATTGGGAAGGARRTSNINGADGAEGSAYTISGASVVYGSGGGSGAWTNSGTVYYGGSGGTGAGNGGDASSTPALRNGTNASNRGAGGGGGAYYGPAIAYGSGGSKVNGIVILRYTPA